jgi:uncharacterized protein (TIGR02246 family)
MRMSDVRWLRPLVLVALLSGCAGTQQAAAPLVDKAAIIAKVDSLNNAWTGAVAAKDTTALAAMYADDAHMLPANGPRVDGRDAIRSNWAQSFASIPGFNLKPVSNSKIISEAGDMVVDLGTYEFGGMMGGRVMKDTGKYVTVLKNMNGEWKIVVDTYNSDLPPPGAK